MNKQTIINYKANQGILPLFFSDFLNINDPVLVFDKFMEGIDCSKFGIMKNDRNYKRIVRRGIESVNLELYLVAIGQNLYKYYNKKMRLAKAA